MHVAIDAHGPCLMPNLTSEAANTGPGMDAAGPDTCAKLWRQFPCSLSKIQRMLVSGMVADDATDAPHRRLFVGTGGMRIKQIPKLTEDVRLRTEHKGQETRI